jgi:drug/metabolite transporter (DMT)-like permease
MKPILMAVPTFFDIAETALKNVALGLISTSVSSMLKSSNLVFTAMLSVYFLNRIFYRHHYSSMGIIVVGVIMTGLAEIVEKDDGISASGDGTTGAAIFGISIMIFG